jgi:hypothetical protein
VEVLHVAATRRGGGMTAPSAHTSSATATPGCNTPMGSTMGLDGQVRSATRAPGVERYARAQFGAPGGDAMAGHHPLTAVLRGRTRTGMHPRSSGASWRVLPARPWMVRMAARG